MSFDEENRRLLEEAASVTFHPRKNGSINQHKHTLRERQLYFIQQSIKVHGNKYLYTEVNYINNSTKVRLVCSIHGVFDQEPASHMRGRGCPKCGGRQVLTTEDFIERARKVHKDTYDYSLVTYTNTSSKVSILCKEHGVFHQIPNDHLQNHGCPKCSGYNHDILYLLLCKETCKYKIGITTGTIDNRISKLGGHLQCIHFVRIDNPRKQESILHKRYADVRTRNETVTSGNTEFFRLSEAQVQEVISYMNEVSNE